MTGPNVLKYVSVFIGSSLVVAIGVRAFWKRKYRLKGLEARKNGLYGWRHTSYFSGEYMLPQFAVDVIEDYRSFQVREDDVWIMGFPKSGTTWLLEVVYLIGHNADLDSVQSPIEDRVPFLEFIYPGIKVIDAMPSPRYIKTHFPFSILPSDYHEKKPKTIYIARNSKDVVVSYHQFLHKFYSKKWFKFNLSFDDYCRLFVDGEVYFGPWWRHVKEGWETRNDDNVLYITYEDMKLDFPGTIKKIASFLNKKLSDEDVEAIVAHCSFESMKYNKFVNKDWYKDRGMANKDAFFLRKGKVGDWKNHLSKECEATFDDIMDTRLKPFGVTFKDPSDEDKK